MRHLFIITLLWFAFVLSASAVSVEFEVTTNSLDQGDYLFSVSTNAAEGGTAFHVTITRKSASIFDDYSVSFAVCTHTKGGSEIHGFEHCPQLTLKKGEKVWKADFIAAPEVLKTPNLCLVFGGVVHIMDHNGKRVPYPAMETYEIKLADFVKQ